MWYVDERVIQPNEKRRFEMREYKYAVWATQGGGLVREMNGTYVFVEKPDCSELGVGDEMPEQWGIIPANGFAQREMDRDQLGV